MSKEYLDRWNKPLVNPGFTMEHYEAERSEFSQEEVDRLVKISQDAYRKKLKSEF